MTTMFDFDSTARFRAPTKTPTNTPTLRRPESAPRLYRAGPTAPLANPEPAGILTVQASSCGDPTTAAAWSTSPLGDPTDDLSNDSADFEADRPVGDAKPRAAGKKTLITAAVVGALGGGVALALVVAGYTGWGQPTLAVVSPNASVGSVAPQAPVAPAPTSEVTPTAPPSAQPTTKPTVGKPAPASVPVVSPAPVPQRRGTGTPGGNQGGANPPPGNKRGMNQPGAAGGQPQHPGKKPLVLPQH